MTNYKTYNLPQDINDVYVAGDCHGKFTLLLYKIKESKMANSAIILAGDVGIGFEKPEYYKHIYNKMKKVLKLQNIHIYMLRGNHDDPDYFDGEKINFSNFIAIPDYSVISFIDSDKIKRNILCIGGATSIDRMWRKTQKWALKGYWENEFPVYCPEKLNKIKEDNISIQAVVTHTSPDFAPLEDKNGISGYLDNDKDLLSDIIEERNVLTRIYNHVVNQDNHPIETWVYGHFHEHHTYYSKEQVKFVMLDEFISRNNSWDIIRLNFK